MLPPTEVQSPRFDGPQQMCSAELDNLESASRGFPMPTDAIRGDVAAPQISSDLYPPEGVPITNPSVSPVPLVQSGPREPRKSVGRLSVRNNRPWQTDSRRSVSGAGGDRGGVQALKPNNLPLPSDARPRNASNTSASVCHVSHFMTGTEASDRRRSAVSSASTPTAAAAVRDWPPVPSAAGRGRGSKTKSICDPRTKFDPTCIVSKIVDDSEAHRVVTREIDLNGIERITAEETYRVGAALKTVVNVSYSGQAAHATRRGTPGYESRKQVTKRTPLGNAHVQANEKVAVNLEMDPAQICVKGAGRCISYRGHGSSSASASVIAGGSVHPPGHHAARVPIIDPREFW